MDIKEFNNVIAMNKVIRIQDGLFAYKHGLNVLGKPIFIEDIFGIERIKYDSSGRKIHSILTSHDGSSDTEVFFYEDGGKLIHCLNYDNGYEEWYRYDRRGYRIYYRNSYGEESIERIPPKRRRRERRR